MATIDYKVLGIKVAKFFMYLAWWGLGIWTTGVVFYNVWGGSTWVWFYLAAVFSAFVFRKKRPVLFKSSWGAYAALIIFYLCIPATNDKEWQTSWSRLPYVQIEGNQVTVKDVRSFVYRTETDFDARYVTRSFDLNKLTTLDFAVSHWDGLEAVAHTMLSFGFEDGQHLALSVETRLPAGVEQSSVAGLYKQFNLIYILADEEDLFGLRTNYRKEDLYLYRLKIAPDRLKEIFIGFAEEINALHTEPRFYNTITSNCSTTLVDVFKHHMGISPWHWTPILNGVCDRNTYNRGELLQLPGENFETLKKRSYIGYGDENNDWRSLRQRWENSWKKQTP